MAPVTPRLISVSYHQAYSNDTRSYSPSMTGLDNRGRVWRTFQHPSGQWDRWTLVEWVVG